MIRKILFIASFFAVGFASAQSFQLWDHNDNDITNTTHYEYGSTYTLGCTKFHVKNLTGSQQSFAIKVVKEFTPSSSSGLGVCFGAACYSASGSASGPQIINSGIGDIVAANGIYTDLKIGPVTWPWVNNVTDSAIWEVTVYNTTNSSDSASARIIWKFRITGDQNNNGIIDLGEIAGDQNNNGVIDGSEIAGDVTGDGVIGCMEVAGDIDASSVIDGAEKLGDISGNGAIEGSEIHGDANGNNVIDSGETNLTSVNELDANSIQLTAYPNPATDNLTISYAIEGNRNNARMDVYDVLGQKVASHALNSNDGQVNLSVNNLNSGVYFYSIRVNEKAVRTERIIVK